MCAHCRICRKRALSHTYVFYFACLACGTTFIQKSFAEQILPKHIIGFETFDVWSSDETFQFNRNFALAPLIHGNMDFNLFVPRWLLFTPINPFNILFTTLRMLDATWACTRAPNLCPFQLKSMRRQDNYTHKQYSSHITSEGWKKKYFFPPAKFL